MKTKILMCPPDFYFDSINYAINPWMKKDTICQSVLAMEQWNELKKTITNLGAEVVTMDAQKGLPDMVFTANAALVYKNIAIISKFKHEERQPEEKFYAECLEQQGFQVKYLPEGISFEGAGDALFSGETLYSGYVPRSDISAHANITSLLDIQVLSLELVDDRFYHLDTCFCPLTDGYLLYFPEAFDDYANKIIEANFPEEKRIVVLDEEASKFSCNAVSINRSVIMNKTSARLKKEIENKGFDLYEVDLQEFLKAGGSAKCLTLKLNEFSNS